ncbi:putative transcription factor [Hibiscus syriacus]|uniref:Transcription factor n=1 Tax=Hibiscus syriacus TaxID=106335 RepID=A0A6A2Y2J0_HIBSY|nr:putative transcription factor [Hibiscus syriacus]
MMEKGFYVSPQQCEDKFNDLNKRYKRVNDILGRGTSCKVVENQSLLESMDLSPKLKEEVRKLLNSKHLFFREMCAYHNSCGHGAGASAGGVNQSPEVATEISQVQHQQAQQQQCLHSSDNSQIVGNLGGIETEASKLAKPSRKRPRKGAYAMSPTPMIQQLSCEVMNVMQDGSKSVSEKKHWMRMRVLQLEEQQVSYQYQAFQLEKQRLKWLKFSGKKEREMERAKLENERRRLENERMVLLLRQKEFEAFDLDQPQPLPQPQMHSCNNKRRDPSNIWMKKVYM